MNRPGLVTDKKTSLWEEKLCDIVEVEIEKREEGGRESLREMVEKRDADSRAVDRVCCARSDVEEARR